MNISGKTIVFTGSLPGLVRNQAFELVKQVGGKPKAHYVKSMDILVVGDIAPRRSTTKLKKVSQNSFARSVEVITAVEFLEEFNINFISKDKKEQCCIQQELF